MGNIQVHGKICVKMHGSMNMYKMASPYASSDFERGLEVLKQFGNVVYLVSECNPLGQSLLEDTLSQWNDSNADANAIKWDMATKPSFDMPFVGLATIDQFREIEKDAALANRLRFVLCNKIDLNIKRDQKVLIIGATAFLGRAFYDVFGHFYKTVVGTGFGSAKAMGMEYLDITNQDEVARFFEQRPDFDIVIYVSGEANADKAQVDQAHAYALNTKPVDTIAKYFKAGQFVHISTEYVFDGEKAPYTSYSKREPKNYYGETKKEAEDKTLANFEQAIIIRMGALYGWNGPADKKTTVGGILNSLKNNEVIDIDELQIKHPILLEDSALTLIKLLDHGALGIYQANGTIGVNKVELSKQMALVWSEVSGCEFTAGIKGNQTTNMSDKPRDTEMVNIDTPRSIHDGMMYMMQKMKASGV